jgi:nitrite reductase/ring-hydroxylating ferredoxin subunit
MPIDEHCIAELDTLADPGVRAFSIGSSDWPFRGIVVHWRGGVHAFANSCAHLGHPLNLDPNRFFNRGRDLLRCSSHGALFEPDSGICVAGPCVGKGLIRLECRVADGRIFVRAPDSQRDLEKLSTD